jgi:hypothetical protein
MSDETEILTAILEELKSIHVILDAISDYGQNNSIGDICGKLDTLSGQLDGIDTSVGMIEVNTM